MKCYNHNNIDSVATCVGCGKALCIECASQFSKEKIVCSTKCAENIDSESQKINFIYDRFKRSLGNLFYFLSILGLIFFIYGVYDILVLGKGFYDIGILGVVMGLSLIIWGLKYKKKNLDDS